MDKQLIERIALEVAKDLVFPGFEIDAVMSSALTKYAGAFLARIDAERGKDAVAWFVNSEPVGRNPHYEQISKEYEGGIGTFPLFFSQTIPEGMALVPTNSTEASLQAKIDELMLEYCPNEMTQGQLDEWARNQRAVPEIESLAAAQGERK